MHILSKWLFALVAIMVSGWCLLSAGCGRAGNHIGGIQEKTIYHCPMHPSYTSDNPGECPICGMDLVKLENTAHDTSAVHGKKTQLDVAEKTLDEVCLDHKCGMKDCPMMVKAHLKPGERMSCPVCGEFIATTGGKVVEVVSGKTPVSGAPASAVHPEGPFVAISQDRQQMIGVKTDTVKIMELSKIIRASGKIAYDPELAIAQEEFVLMLNARDNVKTSSSQDDIDRAMSVVEATRNKLKLLGMTGDEISALEKSRAAGTNLYLPGDGKNVWAYISIYEYEIGSVKPGDSVDIEAVAYPGEKFMGKVVSINPILDPVTRTDRVRVEVANPENKLKPDMFVNASIDESLGPKLAVPETAVLDTGLRKIVYVSMGNNMLESREVTLGERAENHYVVINGLKEGELVVTSGNFLVDSESKLQALSKGK